MDMRQMGGQRATIDPPFPRRNGSLRLLLDHFGSGDCLLDVFQRQIELVGIQPSQTLALGVEALRLAQQLAKPLVHRQQLIPLGNRRIALGDGAQCQRAQCINIVGKRISWSVHAPKHNTAQAICQRQTCA